MKLQDKPEGVMVQQVNRYGAAATAGLSAQDVIIAIDGLKASEKLLATYAKQQGIITILAFRRDELMSFEVERSTIDLAEVELVVQDQSKADHWLKV